MATTSFGFRTVSAEEKDVLVRRVFSSVARRYDLMNDLMSGGLHRLWKDAMVEWLNPVAGRDYLDLAGGTGDIAFRIAANRKAGKSGRIVVCDINVDMLREGMRRQGQNGGEECEWICGNACRLPFENAAFDACTIAFGIRNVSNIDLALREIFRVLKPGGRFICLEFSRVDAPGLDAIYDAYSFSLLPRLGKHVTGDEAAYRYLAESIRRFPAQSKFAKMVAQAGFARVKVRNLSGGIAALHAAWKL